jgi:hypothetical protein
MFSSDITLTLPIGSTKLVLKGRVGMTPLGVEVDITDLSFDGAPAISVETKAPSKTTSRSRKRMTRSADGRRVIPSRVTPPAVEAVVDSGDDFEDSGYGVDDDEFAGLERLVSFGPNTL